LGFGKIIDDIVPWDKKQCYLSPGTRIKALVINILGGRTPLYMVDEFYEGMDTENLFGKGVKPEDLTDYHLARALDKIALAGPQKVFSTLAMPNLMGVRQGGLKNGLKKKKTNSKKQSKRYTNRVLNVSLMQKMR
jgi:hypothetical protein